MFPLAEVKAVARRLGRLPEKLELAPRRVILAIKFPRVLKLVSKKSMEELLMLLPPRLLSVSLRLR
jgi:hypothetical protein